MSKIEMLRVLITQRLTEAAEEIFGVFGRTIAEYEEEISRSKLEIDRQRRLLDLSMKPRVSVQVSGSALCHQQDWSSGPDLKEPRPPHIKEEQEEELWPPQQQQEEEEEEEDEEEQHNNTKFLLFQSSRSRHEQDTNHTTSSLSQLQDLQDPELDPQPGPSVQQTCSDLDEASDPASGNGQLGCIDLETPLAEAVDSYICTICGRAFAQHGHWAKHVQVHRRVETKVDKSYTCDICGKKLTRFDGYQKHLRIHTGEKPYSCDKCGRRFSDNSNYKRHIRTHPGQKPPQS